MPPPVELEDVDLLSDSVGDVELVPDPIDGERDRRPGARDRDVGARVARQPGRRAQLLRVDLQTIPH